MANKTFHLVKPLELQGAEVQQIMEESLRQMSAKRYAEVCKSLREKELAA